MRHGIAVALFIFAVVTPASAGQLYTTVDLDFDDGTGQAWASSVAHVDYATDWWELTPTVGGTHTIQNSDASAHGSSDSGSWSSFITGYAIFGQCGYRATIDAYETNYWTTQGAGTGSECCPMPQCWLNASHMDGGDTVPHRQTVDCGESVDVTAYPYPSYEFDYWDGEVHSTSNPVSVQVTQRPTSIVAYFRPACDPSNPDCICDPGTNPNCPCDRVSDPKCDSGLEPAPCDNCSPDN